MSSPCPPGLDPAAGLDSAPTSGPHDSPDNSRDGDSIEALNLKQAARLLDVHYMTAYRYVRQGRLAAERDGTEWRVTREAIEQFRRRPPRSATATATAPVAGDEAPRSRRESVDWAARLMPPMLLGDEATAWRQIERALAAGHDVAFCLLDMIAAAIATIDDDRARGELDAARQPLATAVALRLTARLGSRFRPSGRSRGSVVFGAPTGEGHHLPIAIVADLIRSAGFDVLELGADSAPDAFAAAVRHAPRLIAVCISVTRVDHIDAAAATIAAVRAEAPLLPVVVGGQAVLNPEVATVLDATVWAPDGRRAVAVIESIWRDRRKRS